MSKFYFKKAILVITIISSMLVPMICNDIVYAMEETAGNEIENSNTTNEETPKDTEEDTPNNESEKGEEEENKTENSQEEVPQGETSQNEEEKEEKEEEIPQESTEKEENQDENLDNNIALTSLEEAGETVVYAGKGELQKAINNATPGDVLVLYGGEYRNDGPITINKSITIKAKGNMPYIYDEIQIKETNKNDKIVFEGFSSGITTIRDEFDYIDVQSPVDLTIKDINFMGVGRGLDGNIRRPSLINVESGADETKLNIENSKMLGYFDGIRVSSSSTNVDINSSKVEAEIGLRIENGSNNTFNINQTEMVVYSYISREDEAILITNQQNLKINMEDCKIRGLDSGRDVDVETKIFSIDDTGSTSSRDVNISITGNSEITEEDKGDNNCIFNFGPNNKPEYNNTAYVGSEVKLPSNRVLTKYNKTDGKDYVVVGIYDRYENDTFGNLTVKTYNKDSVISEVESYEPKTEKGHRFDKWMYKDNTDQINDFADPYKATMNMDVFPKYVETVDVQINEKTYTIDKGLSLNSLEEDKKQEAKNELENLKNSIGDQGKTFKKFVNSKTGESLTNNIEAAIEEAMDYQISEDIEIIAGYNILLTVGEETFILEESKTLKQLMDEREDIKTVVESLQKVSNKEFNGFKNQSNETIEDDTLIEKDTILTPQYKVTVTIKKNSEDTETKEPKLNEGQTLEDLQEAEKELINKLKNPENKNFDHFEDENGNTISDKTEIKENITITPQYTVTITIKNPKEKEPKVYTLKEGQTLADLTETEKAEWGEYIKGVNKEFIWFNEIADEQTKICENITLTPIYNVLVTIKTENGEEIFTLREGKTLADIEDKERYESTKNKEFREFSRFVDEKGNEISENTEINEDIILIPKFKVKVTINKADKTTEEFYIEENQKLGDIKPEDKERYENTKNKEFRKFLRFVDEKGNEVSENTEIKDNITLTPKFNLTIKIGQEEYLLEEGKTLADLIGEKPEAEQELEKLKNSSTKPFSRFVDEKENEVSENTKFEDNATILPKFKIKITVEKSDGTVEEFLIEEGLTLNDLTEEEKQKLNEIMDEHKEGEKFAGFIDTATGNMISENDKLDEDITIKAQYEEVPVIPTNPEENKDSNENKNESENKEEVVSENTESGNPKTSDEVTKYIISGILGVTCIIGSTIILKKRKE